MSVASGKKRMLLRDRVMSGAYDWIIFPAALAFVAVIAATFYGDYRSTREELLKCEQAAVAEGSRERLAGC